ncbi:hypothetical protein GCM10008020_39450 [Massilia psychrophila]|nr:hypothetical protein GCM10008020_39450 [Massilia psychrophila]
MKNVYAPSSDWASTNYTIHEPFNAYHVLGQLCDRLEVEYGLQRVNHQANKNGSENRAADMERHSDVESLLGWIKRECQDQIRSAQSWSQLHQVMHDHGLEIREHANGLIISAGNGISVKASAVHREFSKKNLEGRLGSFAKSQAPTKGAPNKRYEKKPMRSKVNTVELHARYKHVQQSATSARAIEWGRAIARKNRLIEDAKRAGRLKRAAIKISGAPGIGKKLMYAATSKTLIAEIDRINRQYLKERQEIYAKTTRVAWADWLREQAIGGDQEALEALRGRAAAAKLTGDTVAGEGAPGAATGRFKHDSVTKKGTIIYSVGASAVRDDGNKLKVSTGADQAGLQAALRLAMERYGSRITVDGSAAFKEQIAKAAAAADLPVTFTDDAIERRRQELIKPLTTRENQNGNRNGNESSRRRPDRSRDGPARQAAAGRAAAAGAAAAGAGAAAGATAANAAGAARPGPGHAFGHKSDARKTGSYPPPAAQNRVRAMSELGVVQQPDRGQVLLPGDVPGHMEHKGGQPDNGVRRDLYRPARVARAPAATGGKPGVGRLGTSPSPASKDRLQRLSQLGAIVIGERVTPAAPAFTPGTPAGLHTGQYANGAAQTRAADRYIAEREQKRSIKFDIPKHVRYTPDKDRTLLYAGLRQIDGQALALLKHGEEVQVLPVDEATARRLKRIALGTPISVTSNEAIKKKGRSR